MSRRRRYQLPGEREEVREAITLAACAAIVGTMAYVCVRVLLVLASVLAAALVIVQ